MPRIRNPEYRSEDAAEVLSFVLSADGTETQLTTVGSSPVARSHQTELRSSTGPSGRAGTTISRETIRARRSSMTGRTSSRNPPR
jgi:hypothetical protein